jgi:hypothetical protein
MKTSRQLKLHIISVNDRWDFAGTFAHVGGLSQPIYIEETYEDDFLNDNFPFLVGECKKILGLKTK